MGQMASDGGEDEDARDARGKRLGKGRKTGGAYIGASLVMLKNVLLPKH